MDLADIPPLDSALTQGGGYEGIRFVGNSLYDGLTRWDLTSAEDAPTVEPALAESWTANDDLTEWTFALRPGVKFHDGTPWNAEAAVFNLERILVPGSPHFNPVGAGVAALSVRNVTGITAVDDMTLRVTLGSPNAHLPSDLTTVLMGSPTAIREGGDEGFNAHPVGTGPFVFSSIEAGQRLVLLPNDAYWRGAPKLDQLILRPIADGTARVAALRSGEVNWIEYPLPDDIAPLEAAGFHVLQNSYDNIWPWVFDTTQPPWNDRRVRQAANFAIDRDAMAEVLLAGTAEPARQLLPSANPSYTPDDDLYDYDPARARELLEEAGYADGFKATVSYPTAGAGQMVPGAMNELLQQDLAEVGIDIELRPIEFTALLQSFIAHQMPDGSSAFNLASSLQNEGLMAMWFGTGSFGNTGEYSNPEADRLMQEADSILDDGERAEAFRQAATVITEDAPWLFVVNDRQARAVAPEVHGLVQARSWFVDLTTVSVG